MAENFVKLIIGILTAIFTLAILVPILNQIASINPAVSFNFLNILIPLIFFLAIIKLIQGVFDL